MTKKIKLCFLVFFLSSSLFASSMDDKVLEFEKKRFSLNKRIDFKTASIALKKEMNIKGWYGYILDINAQVQGKEITAKDMLFSNGIVIAPDLLDINTGKSLKDSLTPNLTSSYYNKNNLIAGTHNAKDKIVVFSDPLCPFCIDYIPDVINHVKNNKKDIALYYYHFPLLRLHPAADVISKAMIVAHKKGIKDIELKIYQADFQKDFDSRETNQKIILKSINKVLKTNITFDDIKAMDVRQVIVDDMKLGEDVMVEGTPTIFVNGIKDNTKLKYETLGK